LRFDQYSYVAHVEGWAEAMKGFFDLETRSKIERLRDEAFRRSLREASGQGASALAPRFENWRILISPSTAGFVGRTLADISAGLRSHPVDVLCDVVDRDELGTIVQVPAANRDKSAILEMLNTRDVLLGLGDAGAHVQSITNFNYPTQLLAEVVRDQGAVPLAKAIQHMTSRPARFLGMADRGQIAPGMAADLTVFDHAELALTPCVLSADLPGGATRLTQGARGYVATIVNGRVAVADDEPTGERAGTIVAS
jgi:N-acyl-D-aspartate/D-glutamate deacylase